MTRPALRSSVAERRGYASDLLVAAVAGTRPPHCVARLFADHVGFPEPAEAGAMSFGSPPSRVSSPSGGEQVRNDSAATNLPLACALLLRESADHPHQQFERFWPGHTPCAETKKSGKSMT